MQRADRILKDIENTNISLSDGSNLTSASSRASSLPFASRPPLKQITSSSMLSKPWHMLGVMGEISHIQCSY